MQMGRKAGSQKCLPNRCHFLQLAFVVEQLKRVLLEKDDHEAQIALLRYQVADLTAMLAEERAVSAA